MNAAYRILGLVGAIHMDQYGKTKDARPSGASSTKLLSEREVAERWGISAITLQDWRCRQKGPPFIRLGGRMIRYRELDIEIWLIEQESHPAAMRSDAR